MKTITANKPEATKPKSIRVTATALGWYNNRRRRPGDEFTMTLQPHQKLPTWVKEAGEVDPKLVEEPSADDDEDAPRLPGSPL